MMDHQVPKAEQVAQKRGNDGLENMEINHSNGNHEMSKTIQKPQRKILIEDNPLFQTSPQLSAARGICSETSKNSMKVYILCSQNLVRCNSAIKKPEDTEAHFLEENTDNIQKEVLFDERAILFTFFFKHLQSCLTYRRGTGSIFNCS